jgi:hypothetical protein
MSGRLEPGELAIETIPNPLRVLDLIYHCRWTYRV